MTFDSRARPAATIFSAKFPTLFVVPTYNESSNLAELVTRFFSYVTNVHLLIVDDDSPDGTAALCKDLMTVYPDLRLLERSGPRGLGLAYLAGIEYGLNHGYEAIGTMDADLSHEPAYVPLMLTLLETNDVVIGSRYIRDGGTVNWQIRRILLSWLANKYSARLLGIPAHDLTSGFRVYKSEALRLLSPNDVESTGYSFLVELLYRAHKTGARIAESPIIFYDRSMGASKLKTREIYVGAMNLLWLKIRGVKTVKTSA